MTKGSRSGTKYSQTKRSQDLEQNTPKQIFYAETEYLIAAENEIAKKKEMPQCFFIDKLHCKKNICNLN